MNTQLKRFGSLNFIHFLIKAPKFPIHFFQKNPYGYA
ncbi:hypothetical protein [Coxiella endosymbiont of Ornithodoros amblus]|nr:hypothetical protein [Coxiella endosymbiont of Ornithodoros amblus]